MLRVSGLAAALVILLTTGISSSAGAHPHGWIDMRSKLLFDERGRVRAIVQAWLFDELYSAFILDELELSGIDQDEGLALLASEDIATLADYGYFTKFEVDGAAQTFAPVVDYANGVAAERIWLRFELPLTEPVAAAGADVRYAVYDPTYYIEILHVGEEPVQLQGPVAQPCRAQLIEPTPSAEIVGLAAALDRFAQAEDGLGAHFAQWIEVTCDFR